MKGGLLKSTKKVLRYINPYKKCHFDRAGVGLSIGAKEKSSTRCFSMIHGV